MLRLPRAASLGHRAGESMSHPKDQPLAARLRDAWVGLPHAADAERSLRAQLGAPCLALVLLVYLRPASLWWVLAREFWRAH